MRDISTPALAALDSGRFRVRCALRVALSNGDVFAIWDDIGTLTDGTTSFTGAAGRFTVQPSVSAYDQAARSVEVALSGLDTAAVALIDGAPWHQAPITIRRAIIATDSPQVIHLVDEFSGFLDMMKHREVVDGVSTLIFVCESASRELSRSGARTRSDADQRERDSADGFMSYAVSAVTTTIDWGRSPEMVQQRKPGGIAGFLSKIF